MSVWGMTGKTAAAQQIRSAAQRGALSHALILSGEELEPLAQFAAAAYQCTRPDERPCGDCPACRKVLSGIHPDVTVVRDGEHKNIAVDVIRAVRADAYIRPNEGERKVYLFPDCGLLTETDQNVLLKLVEEGPRYAAFLFCAPNPSAILPTLRSRCVELKAAPAEMAEAAALSERAERLCRTLGERKRGAVSAALIRMEKEKLTPEDVQALIEECIGVGVLALKVQHGANVGGNGAETAAFLAKNLTKTQIMRTIELLQTYRQDGRYHIGAGQTLGALAVELEGIL